MDYSLETAEEKLSHLKRHLWDLEHEQKNKGNEAMAYVLQHLSMIAENALMQYREEFPKETKAPHFKEYLKKTKRNKTPSQPGAKKVVNAL